MDYVCFTEHNVDISYDEGDRKVGGRGQIMMPMISIRYTPRKYKTKVKLDLKKLKLSTQIRIMGYF